MWRLHPRLPPVRVPPARLLTRYYGPSAPDGAAVRHEALLLLETRPLVHTYGAGRAVRVHPEADVRVTGPPRRLEHLGHQRAGHALAAPRPAGAHLADVAAGRIVVAVGEDVPGNLVTVERDSGQVRPEVLRMQHQREPLVELPPLRAPVIGERLHMGVI